MSKRELGFRKIHHSILLFFSIFVLAGSVVSVSGAVFETCYASDYNILNGTYLSGGFPASLQTVDSDYFEVKSSSSATSASIYNPSTYNLFGSTSYVSGTQETWSQIMEFTQFSGVMQAPHRLKTFMRIRRQQLSEETLTIFKNWEAQTQPEQVYRLLWLRPEDNSWEDSFTR